jgi:hypothetical protein
MCSCLEKKIFALPCPKKTIKIATVDNKEAAQVTTIRTIHRKPYREREDLQARITALQEIIASVRDSRLPSDSKKRMLNHAVWEVSIARGNFAPEFLSKGVLEGAVGTKIQREHVYKRKWIVEAIVKQEEPLEAILKRIIHCVVTREEHAQLNKIPDTLDGWARYREADIDVFRCCGELPEMVQC